MLMVTILTSLHPIKPLKLHRDSQRGDQVLLAVWCEGSGAVEQWNSAGNVLLEFCSVWFSHKRKQNHPRETSSTFHITAKHTSHFTATNLLN